MNGEWMSDDMKENKGGYSYQLEEAKNSIGEP